MRRNEIFPTRVHFLKRIDECFLPPENQSSFYIYTLSCFLTVYWLVSCLHHTSEKKLMSQCWLWHSLLQLWACQLDTSVQLLILHRWFKNISVYRSHIYKHVFSHMAQLLHQVSARGCISHIALIALQMNCKASVEKLIYHSDDELHQVWWLNAPQPLWDRPIDAPDSCKRHWDEK